VKPIDQTIVIGDGSGQPGNCLQAAVASLLDLELDAVPHFILHEDWLERMVEFAAQHGYRVIYRPPTAPVAFGLAIGPSPRGVGHAVVCIDGEIVWDPHPSRAGLTAISNYMDWGAA
jgi:hypothetical protein